MKKTTRKGASRKAPRSPILALTQIEEKELILDTETLRKLDEIITRNGGDNGTLTRSDVVASLLIDKGQNGVKFEVTKNEPKNEKISLPKSAWFIAEKSAKKSGNIDLSEVVKELVRQHEI